MLGRLTARAHLCAGLLIGSLLVAAPVGAERCDGCVRAGAASVALGVPPGTPLAGYGSAARRQLFPDILGRIPHAFWFKPHTGEMDPLFARALVLDDGRARVVWIVVDLIAVDGSFRRDVERGLREAGVPPGALIVSASHTHSGPGAFLDSALMGMLAVDRYDTAVRAALVHTMVEAVKRADGAKTPARVGTLGVRGPDLVRSRLGRPLEPDLVVVKIVGSGGPPIAVLWNYPIHGTMLGPKNLALSGDVMGIASREIERALGVPALFVNGAVGDVSPRRHGRAAALADGAALAAAVRGAWARAEPRAAAPLATRAMSVALGPPSLSLTNCLARWLPRWLRVPLGAALPHAAELWAVSFGDATGVTIPGELQSDLGRRIVEGARPTRAHIFVAGLSNDYLGYFVTSPDYERTSYIACASLYGADAGVELTRAATALVRSLRDPTGPSAADRGQR